MKRTLSILLAVVLLIGCMSASAMADGDRQSFSWWMGFIEDRSYFDGGGYENNPSMEYLSSCLWNSDEGGQTKLNFTYNVPGTAAAQDNISLLLSTGDYDDLVVISYYSGSVVELYDEGIILDLTPYVEQYMPNYLSYLEAHPEFAKTAMTMVNGEKKYLQLYHYNYGQPHWEGLCYRRDWLVKYGANPMTGEAFSGDYAVYHEDGTPDANTWEDNVVFPSGEVYPKYISDWEWLLPILKTALAGEGIDDGYCLSIPYQGYAETGEWVSSFGGGGSHWYMNGDKIEFGLTSDNFRAYLQCMNTWYKNGWIDASFKDHSGDIFYQIDDTAVRQGKVGACIGMASIIWGRLDAGTEHTSGIVMMPAPWPINDVYGPDSAKGVEPYTLFQLGGDADSLAVTAKAKDKDLVALFSMFDYMYSEEGSVLYNVGMNAEQIAQSGTNFYERYGMDAAYTIDGVDETGKTRYVLHPVLANDQGDMNNAAKPNHTALSRSMEQGILINPTESDQYRAAYEYWNMYINTGRFNKSFESQLSADDSAAVTKINLNVRTFAAKNAPKFITGQLDPFNDKDWNSFVKSLNKYRVEKGTDIYQSVLDALK